MAVERSAPRTNTIEVLDRVLDKGVVIDARVRVSVAGLHLVDIDARVIVASIQTYVKHAGDIGEMDRRASLTSRPERRQLPASREPSRRPRARRPRRTTRASIAYRCARGCAFRRPPSTEGAAQTPCPYEPHAICALEPV